MRVSGAIIAVMLLLGLAVSNLAAANEIIKLGENSNRIDLVSQNEQEINLSIDIGSIELNRVTARDESFVLLTGDGLGRSNKIGEPDLPLVRKIISIPCGSELRAEAVAAEYQEIKLADFGLTDPIIPVQPPMSKSLDPDDVPFEYNRQQYQKSGYYNLPLVNAYRLGTMRALDLGMIEVAPIEYDPVNNILKVFKHLEIRIIYDHPDWQMSSARQRDLYSPVFEVTYNKIFNYEPAPSIILDTLTSYPIKYLIVSDRMFEAQLQPFIAWKTLKGFTVTVGYTDIIGGTTTAIHNWIQGQYNNPPDGLTPSFVLLVGDTPQIPTYDGNAGSHVTDLRYVEFTSDDFPEIYIGRFSAQNTSQLQPQIDKTLEYEQYTMPDPGYLGEVTLIAGVDSYYAQTHGNGQINYGTNLYFNLAHGIDPNVWLYPASDDPGAAAAIIQTVNNGIGFINYTAHCGHTGFSDPPFTVSDINGLTNQHKYLLGIGNCCLSNTFDESTPCFGEAWLQAANKGGVGYIGGTNSTYWNEDYWWGVGAGPVIGSGPEYSQTGLGAYDGIFHDHGEPVTDHYITNAAIIYCGNMAVDEGGGHSQYYWEIYNLMGDPSVMNYMGVPSTNNVIHAGTVLITATSFAVNADPGSYVGISMNGVLHGAAYIGQSGTADVPLVPFGTPGTADIVVTAQNRQPYTATVQVISPSGPYVIFDSRTINDGTGNDNGLVDAGESIVLGVQLVNVGPDAAQNVSAALSTSNPYVTFTDSTENYGTINGNNGTVYIADAFSFTVSSDAPDGQSIVFNLEVTGTALDTWSSSFSLTVHAPDLGFVSLVINDVSGNGNGIFDPGESVELTVTVINDGTGRADNVSGILSESDGFVSISDANGAFGYIAPDGGTADNSGDTYAASASSSCPQGYTMTFQLDLSADLGYSAILDFDVIIGDRSVIFADDFSIDQGWSGLGGTGEWMIGSAGGGAGSDSYGGPDPAQDHSPSSDNGILGNDITTADGDYNSSMTTTYWVTSPVIDCADYSSVIMKYYHWLGIERDTYDNAYFQVFNGTSWITIFENGSSTIDEGSWVEDNYDLSAYADENPDFRIRYGIGITDGSWQYCGWNIDDIEIKGYFQGSSEPPDLAYDPSSFADSLAEGDTGVHQLTVSNNGIGNLRFRLSSSDNWLEFDGTQYYIAPAGNHVFDITVNAAGLAPGNHTGSLNFTSNDPDMPSGSIPVNLHIYEPDIFIAQSNISETLNPGQQSSVPLVIANNGQGRLNYSVGYQVFDNPLTMKLMNSANDKSSPMTAGRQKPIGFHPLTTGKDTEPEPIYPPMIAGSGGPDAYGYSWIDSDESGGPAFSWVDISSIGTPITGLGDDQSSGPFPIGFSFNFYGTDFSTFRFCTNGFISFTSSSTDYSNDPIPTGGNEPLNLVAPFWDDLYFPSGGSAYYYSDNSDSLVISWLNVPHISSGGPYTFQMILLSNGKIIFQYQSMSSPLNSATIGIQNSNGTIGLQVAYNQAYVQNGLAVMISAGPDWLDIAQTSGSVDPFGVDTVDVLFDATDLEDGNYSGQITINSNDPINPVIDIPVSLTVGIDGALIALNLSSILDSLQTGQSSQTNLIISNTGNLDLNYSLSDNRSWISFAPDNGTVGPGSSDTAAITLDAASLPEGNYSGTLTVTSDAINEPTIDIPVSLAVVPPPVEPDITLNLTEINETSAEGGQAEVDLVIGNIGTGELTYSIIDDRDWLTESPDNGIVTAGGQDSILVVLDASELTEGTYTGSITVNSDDPDEASVVVPVTFTVNPAGAVCDYIPGDINGDGNTIGSDITFAVNYFRGGSVPQDSCWHDSAGDWLYTAGDVNGDCLFIGSDITYYVNYFRGINPHLSYCPDLPPSGPGVSAAPLDIESGQPGEVELPFKKPVKTKIPNR